VLAKGGRPVVDDVGRVPGQRFHEVVVPPASTLHGQPQFTPRHGPELVQRDVMLPTQSLVLVIGDTLPRGGAYASPSSSSPASSSSSPAASSSSSLASSLPRLMSSAASKASKMRSR